VRGSALRGLEGRRVEPGGDNLKAFESPRQKDLNPQGAGAQGGAGDILVTNSPDPAGLAGRINTEAVACPDRTVSMHTRRPPANLQPSP
jgi:hypothetical protein